MHLVRPNQTVGTEAAPVMVVHRRRRSGWDLAEVLPSWVGSRRTETEEVRCMRRSQAGRRTLVVQLVSSKLRGAIRSLGDP